jgi:hypothetical protein
MALRINKIREAVNLLKSMAILAIYQEIWHKGAVISL